MRLSLPIVVAHKGVTDSGANGNTLFAFAIAVARRAEMVELDARACRDTLVVSHGAEIDGVVLRDHTYAELRTLLGSRTPPSLEAALIVLGGRVSVDLEIKEPGIEAAIVPLLQRHCTPSNCVITSFQDWVITEVKRLWPQVPAGLLLPRAPEFAARYNNLHGVAAAQQCGADFIGVNTHGLAAGTLDEAWAAHLPVLVWTVNDRKELRLVMRDNRITAVCTDRVRRAHMVRALTPRSRHTTRQQALRQARGGASPLQHKSGLDGA